jgi:hypothetical protein
MPTNPLAAPDCHIRRWRSCGLLGVLQDLVPNMADLAAFDGAVVGVDYAVWDLPPR